MAQQMSRRPSNADFGKGPVKSPEQERRERVLALAHGEAIKAGVAAALAGGAGSFAASKLSPNFAKYMSISAKVSLPVMAGMFMFSLRYEHAISAINRNPHAWGLSDKDALLANPSIPGYRVTTMPIHHRLMNGLYDNTFGFIFCTGAPFAAYILSQQLKLTHHTLSQRVMHSRVFAQAGILTIGLSTLAFREFMDKRGRFPEPSDE